MVQPITENVRSGSTRSAKSEPNFLPGGTHWAKAVVLPDEPEPAGAVRIAKGNLYSVPGANAQARKAGDPVLAPHGALRAMRYCERTDLLRFLREFGPLEWRWDAQWRGPNWREYAQQHRGEEPTASVDAADFWRKQLLFRLIAQLWEAWPEPSRLQDAFINLALERQRLGQETWARLIPILRILAHLDKLPNYRAALWERPDVKAAAKGLDFEEFVSGMRNQSPGWLRNWASMIIQSELDFQSRNRRALWVRHGKVDSRVWFQQELELSTLWAGVWELLALDFAQPLPWRVCPHCDKLFYPPRKDRFYCTPEQQALASKRNWARRARSDVKTATMRKQGSGDDGAL